MALTITFDGTGIVAYADGRASDTGGGSWGELGGGTVADNPDVYIYGSQSIASKYASKNGYTYYTDNGTINYPTTSDLMYVLVNIQSNGAFLTYNDAAGTYNGSFNVVAGQDTNNLRHWNVASKGASNGWTGGWKCFVVDPTITTGTETDGTPTNTAIDVYGVWIDTDVSVRAESIFQSMIIAAKGAIVTGTPTITGGGFDELAVWCTDYTNRAFGLIEIRGTTYFQKGGITVGDGTTSTTFEVDGNVVECEESSFYNGTTWVTSYPSDANYIVTTANASLDFVNVTYSGYTDNKLQIDISLGNASSFAGGVIKLLGAISVKSTDTFDAVVFSTNDALNLGTASYDNCTFVECGSQTVSSTTSFDANTLKSALDVTALITDDLEIITNCTFISGGGGHGINLGTIAASDTMSWANYTSGYETYNAAGTSTGDEAILVSVASGQTLTINVSTGYDLPSFYNTGAGTVSVVSSVDITITVKDSGGTVIESAQVGVFTTDDNTEIINEDSNASGIATASYGGSTPREVKVWIRKASSGATKYKNFSTVQSISSTGLTLSVTMVEDPYNNATTLNDYDLTDMGYTSAQIDAWLIAQNDAGLSNKLLIITGNDAPTSASDTARAELAARYVVIET